VADLVTPVRDSLSKVDVQIQQMEIARGEAYGDLRAQVQSLITTQKELQSETGNLVRALRTPNVRGRWEKFNCGAWSRSQACCRIAISPSKKPSSAKADVSGPIW